MSDIVYEVLVGMLIVGVVICVIFFNYKKGAKVIQEGINRQSNIENMKYEDMDMEDFDSSSTKNGNTWIMNSEVNGTFVASLLDYYKNDSTAHIVVQAEGFDLNVGTDTNREEIISDYVENMSNVDKDVAKDSYLSAVYTFTYTDKDYLREINSTYYNKFKFVIKK